MIEEAIKTEDDAKRARLLDRLKYPKLLFQAGFVYLVKCQTLYKIGSTKNPTKRLRGLQSSTPFPLELLHTILCRDVRTCEILLHLEFKSKHVRGEWFELSEEDVNYIKGITAL